MLKRLLNLDENIKNMIFFIHIESRKNICWISCTFIFLLLCDIGKQETNKQIKRIRPIRKNEAVNDSKTSHFHRQLRPVDWMLYVHFTVSVHNFKAPI